MGLWSAYFFAKLLMFAGGYIDFHVGWNLLFAAFTALPPQNARQKLARNMVAVPLSIILLYHDSWLPPPERVIAQAGQMSAFSLPYFVELASRFISLKLILSLTLMLVVYSLVRRKLRLSTFVFIAILAVMFFPDGVMLRPGTAVASVPAGMETTRAASRSAAPAIDPRNMRPEALDETLASFYSREEQRRVRFPTPAEGSDPYDIIVLHVCSLSWDDLQAVGRESDPFFSRFSVLMTRFNSAASYSGPAAVRLLRGSCGQTTHKQLYDAPRSECLIFDGFQRAGFEPHWLMNHDGHFGNFIGDVRERGGMSIAPDDNKGARIALRAFDDSPVYEDYSVLSQWWAKRMRNPAPRTVLYYNSTTLHDGNRMPGGAGAPFNTRVGRFLEDMTKFMDDVSKSGRRAIVIFVPEHGAALLGDRRQISGLREIPTPAITQVPVGVAVLGGDTAPPAPTVRVDGPSSYLGLFELVARMMGGNPFDRTPARLIAHTQNLPQEDPVAENEGTVVMRIGNVDMLRTPDGEWSHWDPGR